MNQQQPDTRLLRSLLFWSARWLFGGSHYHSGSLKVRISEIVAAESPVVISLHPNRGEEMYGPTNGPFDSELVELAPKLLAAFVSPCERAILRSVAERGPLAAKAIITTSGVERGRCYVLIAELAERRLILETNDGYVIGDTKLWATISQRDETIVTRAA